MDLAITGLKLRSSIREIYKALSGVSLASPGVPVRMSSGVLLESQADTLENSAMFGLTYAPVDVDEEVGVLQDAIVELTLTGMMLYKGTIVVVSKNLGKLCPYNDLIPGDVLQLAGWAIEDNVLQVKPSATGIVMANPSPPLAVTLTGNIDNADWGSYGIIEIDGGAANRNVTGMLAGYDGQPRLILNVGATNNIVLKHEVTSVAANRLYSQTGADVSLTPGQSASLYYREGTLDRWRILTP